MLAASVNDQCKLVVFPPLIACSRKAIVTLDDLGRWSGVPTFRGHEEFSVFHGDKCLGTSPIDGQVPVQFKQPGSKILVAHVVPPPFGSAYLVQSQLLVVPGEEEELGRLVHHQVDDESERWFVMMMSRHHGELDWRDGYDQVLRRYIAKARDPADENTRRIGERHAFFRVLTP